MSNKKFVISSSKKNVEIIITSKFELIIFFGGIIYPFFRKNSNNLLNEETQFTDWIFPTFCCFPSSIVCLFLYLLNKLYKLLCYGNPGVDLWESCNFIPDFLYFRTSEIIELYISIFFLIYISYLINQNSLLIFFKVKMVQLK